jgi:molybdate transport system ATP-binding protein
MALKIDLKKSLPSFDLNISLRVGTAELKVLIGPSGSGKSTLIRMIAGLEKPDHGVIQYNGETWVDTSRKIFVKPQKRNVGYVFQDYRLFPHLTVYENAAFAAEDKNNVAELLDLLGIGHLKHSLPHKISGGERQRCAICQNLAKKPRILLLDEPFSALDVENRRKLRRELKALKVELSLPIIHVTHDLDEALYLGDEVLPLVEGVLTPHWLERLLEETGTRGDARPPFLRGEEGFFRRTSEPEQCVEGNEDSPSGGRSIGDFAAVEDMGTHGREPVQSIKS